MVDEVKTENTDLIDVGDIEPNFEEEIAGVVGDDRGARPLPILGDEPQDSSPSIAPLKDRFAAFLIDITFLYAIYWAMMIVYRMLAFDSPAGPIPAAGVNGLIFHGIFLLVALVWFVIPEFAFSSTVGKFMCRLTVLKSDGLQAGFFSILLRNLLRPLDILLFPLLVAAAVLEWSKWHQRIGDLIGRTIVIKRLGNPPRKYDLSTDVIASASRRAVAFAIDLVLLTVFTAGYALLLNPDQPLVSMLLVVISPIVVGAFIALPEWVADTSPGKWILGLAICREGGSTMDLPSAIVRTVWRATDTNMFGFLTCYFATRNQRPGDVAASTYVIRSVRSWLGFVILLSVVAVSSIFAYAGLQNRDNFLSGDFQINFLPSVDLTGTGRGNIAKASAKNLSLENFRFAVGSPETIRKPSIFQPGETLFLIFDVGGYTLEDAKAWLQEDLSVSYPDGSVGLKLENINDFNREVPPDGLVRFENTIALPANAKAGRYTITITVRDKLSRRELKEQRFFYITPPEGQVPSPNTQNLGGE